MSDPALPSTEALLTEIQWLRRLAARLVGDPHAAEDLAQQAALAGCGAGREAARDRRGWLTGVTRKLALQGARGEARRRRREQAASRDEAAPATDELVARVEVHRHVTEAVLALREPYRSTVLLRFFEDLSAEAIAHRHRVAVSTVRVRLARALAELRRRLDRTCGSRRAWIAALWPAASGVQASVQPLTTGAILMLGRSKLTLISVLLGLPAALWWLAPAGRIAPPSAASEPAVLAAPTAPAPRPPTRTATGPTATAPLDLATQTCCVVGQVTADGRPVAAAIVTGLDDDPQGWVLQQRSTAQEPPTAITGDDGVFRLAVEPQRGYAVRAEHPDFAPAVVRRCFAGQRRDLALGPGAEIHLSVVAEDSGHPVPNARVGAQPASDVASFVGPWDGSTDAAGRAVLRRVAPGIILVQARAPTFATRLRRLEVPAGAVTQCRLELRAEAQIGGEVVDATTTLPIEGATITCGEHQTRTDARGAFRLDGLGASPQASRGVLVRAAGYAPEVRYVRLVEPGAREQLHFALQPGPRADGSVIDAAGQPVAGAAVRYAAQIQAHAYTAEWFRGEVRTDLNGAFNLPDVRPGAHYWLVAKAPLFGRAGVRWQAPDAGAPWTIEPLVLTVPGSLAGAATLPAGANAPWPVQLKRLASGSARGLELSRRWCDPSGAFSFDDLAAGRYRLSLMRPDESGQRADEPVANAEVELAPGQRLRDLVLRTPAWLAGRVVDPDGEPLADIEIEVFDGEAAPPVRTRSADDGTFAVSVPHAGPFRVRAVCWSLNHDPAERFGVRVDTPLDLVLRPRATPHTIAGQILDAQAHPVADVFVRFTDRQRGRALHRVAVPTDDGRFVMRNLDATAYDLEILDFDDRFENAVIEDVSPGDVPIVFRVVRR
ncbi:MAG: carboxypeptidase regulatory-like domain-containing protein [Planctomycetota bacterium]